MSSTNVARKRNRVVEVQSMLFDVAESTATAGSDCGANGPGGGGFQPGNTCGGKDGAGDAIGGGSASTKKGRMEAFKQEILDAADKVGIEEVDVIPDTDPVDVDDYDEMENRLDRNERAELKDYMEEMRSEAAEAARDYAMDDVSEDDIWDEAGWGDFDTFTKVDEEAKYYFSDDTYDAIHSWMSSDSTDGLRGDPGMSAMLVHIDDMDVEWSEEDDLDGFKDAVRKLRDKASNDYEKAQIKIQDDAVENFEWDSLEERIAKEEWLDKFRKDNPGRFDADIATDTWLVTPQKSFLRFKTSSGNTYDINAEKMTSGQLGIVVHDIGFYDSKGSFAVTGAGSAHEVFSHVMKNVTAYADFHNPTAMTFMAKEPSRRRLYDRVVKSLAAVMPEYSAMYTEDENWRYYAIVKRDKRDEAKEALKTHRKTEPTVLVEQWTEMEPRCDWKWRVSEAFCPTGKDGGVDNSCPPNRDNGTSSSSASSPMVNPKVESWAKEKFGDESKAKAFAKWFGDSKVVDEDGKPLVVYHGGPSPISEFDPAIGKDIGGFGGEGVFFSSSADVASSYSDHASLSVKQAQKRSEDVSDRLEDFVSSLAVKTDSYAPASSKSRSLWMNDMLDRGSITRDEYDEYHRLEDVKFDDNHRDVPESEYDTTPSIMPVHLKIENPKIVDANGMNWDVIVPLHMTSVDRKKHDGIIIRNIKDNGDDGSVVADTYVAFRPTQIKSATGNRGTFDPSSPKITEAFCPTGEGGGVDNSCGSGDRPTTSGRTSQPKGFRSLGDAIKLAGLDSETRDQSKSDTKPAEPKIRTVVRNESEVNDWLQRLDIPKVDRQVLSQSAGALEGSTVVMMGGRGGVHMEVHDDRYRAVTSVQRSAEGDLYLENWNFQVFPHERGRGLGTEIIKTQIDAAHQMGARGIVVHSIGDWKRRETHNGYYTWPRMGFDGDLPRDWQSRMMATGLTEIPEQFSQASRVSDFFKKPEGRELWKRHGFPMELAFDVQPGSLSRKVFDNYYSAQTRRQAEIKQEEDDTEQARAERWRRMDAVMREFDANAGESSVTKPPENHNSFDLGVDDDESIYGAAWDALSGLATESSSGNLVPPKSVRSNAKRGLELRAKNGGKGGTIVGVARARDLSNGSSLSPRTIGRMVSFFARHQGNQDGGVDDEGRIAWLLWGGDAGKRWANARWEEIQRNRGIASESLDSGDNCGTGDGGFQPGNTCASSGGGSSKPTKKEKQALQDYSTDKFVEINGQLRSGKLSKEIAAMTGLIDSALEKMPKREGATVRSFTVGSDEEFAKISAMLKEGGVFTDASYMSTRKTPTLSDKVAFSTKTSGNRHVVMRVEGKSGVDISDISLNPGEGEVLYPRGARFKVNKVIATKGGGLLAVVSEIQRARG